MFVAIIKQKICECRYKRILPHLRIIYGDSAWRPCYKMQLYKVFTSLKLSYSAKINNCGKWINIVLLEDRGNLQEACRMRQYFRCKVRGRGYRWRFLWRLSSQGSVPKGSQLALEYIALPFSSCVQSSEKNILVLAFYTFSESVITVLSL